MPTDKSAELAKISAMQYAKDGTVLTESIVDIIRNTSHFEVLDEAALFVESRQIGEAVPAIIDRIADPYTVHHRSTLLFSCSRFDCSEYFEILVQVVFEDEYSAAMEALSLIQDNCDNVTGAQFLALLSRIEGILGADVELTEDREELLEELAAQADRRISSN